MVPLVRLRHNNQTGRWLTPFRARWDPSSDDHFVVGSMEHPRQVYIDIMSNFVTMIAQGISSIVRRHIFFLSGGGLVHSCCNGIAKARDSGYS